MSRNVYKEEIELIKLPSVAESEKRGRELCGVPFPVLADTADSRYWKNDRTGLAFKLDSITVELEALNGTLYAAPGLPIAFPHQSDAVGFVIDWRQLIDGGGLLRAGCYKVKVSWTKSSLSGSFYYGSYDLKNYSTDTSEGTARLFVVLNDFVRSEGINFKDSGFATTFRFEGRFGDMQPNYETTNNVLTNRIQEKVRNQANRTYTLKTQFLRSCFTHKIDHEHLLAANRIYISDYNVFNHKQYKDFPVILDEEQSPEYNYPGGSILASVTAYFKDKQLLSESKYDGNIQGSDNIILELPTGASGCADGFAQNSNATFTLTVPSGTTQPIPDSAITANGDALTSLPATTALDVEVVDTLGDAVGTSIVSGKVQVNDLPAAPCFPYEAAQFIIDPNNANYFVSPNGLSLVGDATYQTFNSTPYVSPFLTFNGVDQYAELTALKFHVGIEESLSFHAWVEIDYSLSGPFPLILPTSFSSGNGAFYVFWDGFSKNLVLRGYNSFNALTSYLLGDVVDGFTNTPIFISVVHDFKAQETKMYRNGVLFSTTSSVDVNFPEGNLVRRIGRVGGLYSNHKQGLTTMYSKKHTTESLTIFNLTKSTYGY